MIKKGLKFKLGTADVEILSASNSDKTNNGKCQCKTQFAKFKLHYSIIKNLLNEV